MPKPRFKGLKKILLKGGVAPRFVQRTILELQDHYADIEQAALDAGLSAQESAAEARVALGSERSIAQAVLEHPEFKNWVHKWPLVARGAQATLLFVALPAAPLLYCAYRGSSIARWGVSASLALLITGGLLLGLQWLIALS